ncbi:hypothetical protein M9H77_03984 [Catharanthus roseus]|uniref:Uncharacterized protein n=1 Tax=Catharanthus roseus TaxID=4058 RepID=A0ACC0CCV7_CATRO|nr:hypothetical protein M9H77_03984 [Catharanthus roseus]
MKSRSRIIDVPIQVDAFQENVDVHEGSTIDMMIGDVGPLVHKSHLLEEFDIAIETYFEEVKNNETEIEWDSNEDSDKDAKEDSNDEFDNDSDEDPTHRTLCD